MLYRGEETGHKRCRRRSLRIATGRNGYALLRTNHGFTLAVKHFSDEHRADRETHGIIHIANAVTPLLLVTVRTDQSFTQALVSVAERLRQAGSQGPHGLPNQIVIQNSAERKGRGKD